MAKTVIKNEGDPRKYFAMIPHLVDRKLDPFAYRLYGCLVHMSQGEAEVEATTRDLAARCQMSTGKVSEAKARLVGLGWIEIKPGYRHTLIIKDIWAENIRIFEEPTRSYTEQAPSPSADAVAQDAQTRSPHEHVDAQTRSPHEHVSQTRSPHEQVWSTRSPHEQVSQTRSRSDTTCSPHEHVPERKEDKKKKEYIPLHESNDGLIVPPVLVPEWQTVLAELQATMPPGTFRFVDGSRLYDCGNVFGFRGFQLAIPDAGSVEWVRAQMERRLLSLIQQVIIKARIPVSIDVIGAEAFTNLQESATRTEGESVA